MPANDLGALSVFLTVAEERSFTKAAKRLCVSPSAISHSMRELEEQIGVRLLSRTTRSVAPTGPGEHLLTRLRPALADIQEAVDQVSGLRSKAAGRVRLLVPGWQQPRYLHRSLVNSPASIRTSCSTSSRTTVACTS